MRGNVSSVSQADSPAGYTRCLRKGGDCWGAQRGRQCCSARDTAVRGCPHLQQYLPPLPQCLCLSPLAAPRQKRPSPHDMPGKRSLPDTAGSFSRLCEHRCELSSFSLRTGGAQPPDFDCAEQTLITSFQCQDISVY